MSHENEHMERDTTLRSADGLVNQNWSNIRVNTIVPKHIYIEPGIKIDSHYGTVSIPDGVNLDEASRHFWKALEFEHESRLVPTHVVDEVMSCLSVARHELHSCLASVNDQATGDVSRAIAECHRLISVLANIKR